MYMVRRKENLAFSNLKYLAPIQNVATLEASAVVSEGVSRVRNALINGDYVSYDWDSGMKKINKNYLINHF
jgi:hypothetical protein